MPITQQKADPVSRCRICGKAEIVAVCHHCGATLCMAHATNGAPYSPEFRGHRIPRRGWNEEPIHCVDCVHRPASGWDVAAIVLAGVILVALAAVWWDRWLVSIPLVALALYAFSRALRDAPLWHAKPLERCPVVPEISNERIVETYHYRSTLTDDGTWTHALQKAKGQARADLRFSGDDQWRVKDFSNNGGPGKSIVDLDAGFVVLDVREPLAVDGINVVKRGDRFGAERVSLTTTDVPFLLPDDGSPVHEWKRRFDIRHPGDGSRIPVQVFPVLTAGADRQVLEVHLTWPDTKSPADLWAKRRADGLAGRRPIKVERLQLRLPVDQLGAITAIDGDPAIFDDPATVGGNHRIVRWEHVAIEPGDATKRLRLHVEKPIAPEMVIEGKAVLAYPHSAAGLWGMTWFDPLGRPLKIPRYDDSPSATTIKTLVKVDFGFSMRSLAYHHELVQPEKPIDIPPKVLTSVPPDHLTAIAIARELTDAGLTISHLRESAFAPSDRSGEDNRVWELRGRYYQGTAPLDFEITISGADLHRRMTGSTEGWRLSEVTVAGRASYDDTTTQTGFQVGLTNIEDRTRAALERLANQGPTPVSPSPVDPPSLPVGIGIDDLAGADPAATWDPSTGPRPATAPGPTPSTEDGPDDTANHHRERICSVCGQSDEHGDYSVCHHCGRLLCLSRCSVDLRRDPAFSRGLDRIETAATHCSDCYWDHHSIARFFRNRR